MPAINHPKILVLCMTVGLAVGLAVTPQLTLQGADPPDYTVRVTDIQFRYGGGKGPTDFGDNHADYYYRAYGKPGTVCAVTAEMNTDGIWQPMYGDVTLTLRYTNGTHTGTFPVVVHNGSNTGSAPVPYSQSSGFSASWLADGTTSQWTYTVIDADGTFCRDVDPVSSSDSASILWDRNDPPSDANFPPAEQQLVGLDLTATTVRLFWPPVNTATTVSGRNNSDFYEYRVKFRQYTEDGTLPWRTWGGSKDPSLRGISNNPADPPDNDPSLHYSEGRKYTTLPNLKIFTQYEFYIEAVDVFGNVTPPPDPLFTFTTQPFSITVEITDGINSYSDFTDLSSPENRSVRETNIKLRMQIVSSDTPPDFVRVWYTAESDATDIVSQNQTPNTGAFPENTLFSVEAKAESANRWVAYLSSDSEAVSTGNTVRFVVETQTGGVPVFADYDISDLDPNDDEWTFTVDSSPGTRPWPVRILNNVITDRNPRAYPSYYLTDDAYVTIRVYDIKGRQVSSILEKGFRRGGINIKENGWRGINKSGYKLGVGLYYIRIKARRASDGKIILDATKKVVMAR